MQADETGVTKGSHDKFRSVYREVFADRGMYWHFDERACHLFLEKRVDYTVYPMLEEQARVTGY